MASGLVRVSRAGSDPLRRAAAASQHWHHHRSGSMAPPADSDPTPIIRVGKIMVAARRPLQGCRLATVTVGVAPH